MSDRPSGGPAYPPAYQHLLDDPALAPAVAEYRRASAFARDAASDQVMIGFAAWLQDSAFNTLLRIGKPEAAEPAIRASEALYQRLMDEQETPGEALLVLSCTLFAFFIMQRRKET